MRPTSTDEKKAPLNLDERGRGAQGPISSDKRLFIQFHAFTGAPETPMELIETLKSSGLKATLYLDANDPNGIGLAIAAESPDTYVTEVRSLLNAPAFAQLTHKPDFTMLGRTYSIGYEPDLEETLIKRPHRHLLTPAWPWAIWYPLRRKGGFLQLPAEEQRRILMEHGSIGKDFGDADFARDIRLACHGLDTSDNDFVIGLVGKELFPLSAIVQRMRSTIQTSTWIEKLGPFFVGKAIYMSELPEEMNFTPPTRG